MIDEKLVQLITEEVLRQLEERNFDREKRQVLGESALKDPLDPDSLARMKKRTTARIGVGKCGPRLNTQTLLKLRADHASARDSVFADVDQKVLDRMGLFTVVTDAGDKNTYLTRPDLGRHLNDEAVQVLKTKCVMDPDVQIYVSDGLSSAAVEANVERILPILIEGCKGLGLKVGTPFFMKFGRVAAQDQVAEITGAKITCVLIGERPGLATAESMSAYIVYNGYVGIPEAKRTVVSNIHKDGLTAVEAGAYIVEMFQLMLEQKASGVDLVK